MLVQSLIRIKEIGQGYGKWKPVILRVAKHILTFTHRYIENLPHK